MRRSNQCMAVDGYSLPSIAALSKPKSYARADNRAGYGCYCRSKPLILSAQLWAPGASALSVSFSFPLARSSHVRHRARVLPAFVEGHEVLWQSRDVVIAFFFLLGIVIGSFLNVCIARIPEG